MHLNSIAVSLVLPFAEALRSSGNGVLAQPEVPTKRVAIIGAGAAGASTAYHLSQYASDSSIPTHITVFERNPYIGGRTTTVHAWSDSHLPVELGGSIFVSVNHILVNASRDFGLLTTTHDPPAAKGTPELGVWNGREFVVVTRSEDGWWDKARLLWRYGLAPIKTNRLMKTVVGKFLSMYDEEFPFKSLNEVVEKVELKEVASVTGQEYLKANGIGELFAKEIIQASTRVNYASNLGLIHGLETMVCMATNGAMAIEGGNWQLFAQMLKKASATTHLETTVTKISKQLDGTYNLTTSEGETSTFDTVVLAAPLQFSGLIIDPAPKHVPDQIPYVNLHVTLFASPHELDPAAFNLPADEKVPQFVLTTLPEDEDHGSNPNGVGSPGFFSISVVNKGLNPGSTPKNRPEYIYKIFSAEPASSKFLSKILGKDVTSKNEQDPNSAVTWIVRKLWHSYPYEYPRVTFEEIELDDGLWYTSGIESFISTMETSALMGRNVAKLIADEWSTASEKFDPEEQNTAESLKVQGDGWKYEDLDQAQQRLNARL